MYCFRAIVLFSVCILSVVDGIISVRSSFLFCFGCPGRTKINTKLYLALSFCPFPSSDSSFLLRTLSFSFPHSPQAFVAGSFLHSADVGLAAMTQQVDPMVVKGALFDTMLNFETDPEILHK